MHRHGPLLGQNPVKSPIFRKTGRILNSSWKVLPQMHLDPLPQFKKVSLTTFRTRANAYVEWIDRMGTHVWITKHRRLVAGVVPFYQLRAMERLMGKDITDHERDIDAKRRRVMWAAHDHQIEMLMREQELRTRKR